MALLFKLALYSDFLWLQDGFQQFKFYILLGSSITKKKKGNYIVRLQSENVNQSKAIPPWTRPVSSDLGSSAGSGLVSTWMGENMNHCRCFKKRNLVSEERKERGADETTQRWVTLGSHCTSRAWKFKRGIQAGPLTIGYGLPKGGWNRFWRCHVRQRAREKYSGFSLSVLQSSVDAFHWLNLATASWQGNL